MFYCQYKISKEDDEILEFRHNQKHLYFNIVIGLALFAYFTIIWKDSIAYLFAFSVGALFLILGIAPLFYNREIIIDKKKKEFIFIVGARRFYSRKKIIHFDKINHIEICASPFETGGDIEAIKDTIYLNLKGENKLKLGISCSEDYSNILTYKLSESIGCKVVCV